MANYAVTTYTTEGSAVVVAAALETRIETVDTTKTIRLYSIVQNQEPSTNQCIGILVYDT